MSQRTNLEPLFRREVIERSSRSVLADIALSPPKAGFAFGLGSLMVIALLAASISLGSYERRQTVRGYISPVGGVVTVSAPRSATVRGIHVGLGEEIAANQRMATLRDGGAETTDEATGDSIRKELIFSEQTRLEDIQEHRNLLGVERQRLLDQIRSAREQSALLEDQIELEQKKASSAEQLAQAWEPHVATGLISKAQFIQQQDHVLELSARVIELRQRAAVLTRDRSDLALKLVNLTAATRRELRQSKREAAETRMRLAENKAQRATALYAPVRGRVGDVLVHPGDSVAAGQPMLRIYPAKSPSEIVLWGTSDALAFVEPGTKVTLRYDAYPYEKYGARNGTVTRVSRVPTQPEDVERLTGQRVDAPVYRMFVSPAEQTISTPEGNQPLLPGATLTADLLTGRERIYEVLLEPLRRVRRRADSPIQEPAAHK